MASLAANLGDLDLPVMTQAVAKSLLSDIATANLVNRQPGQVRTKHRFKRGATMPHRLTVDPSSGLGWLSADLFEVLLDRIKKVERDLTEFGYSLPLGRRYDLAAYIDQDGQVATRMCAVIDDDTHALVIDIESPIPLSVITSDSERTLGDRVRVTCELVRLYRDAICLIGLPDSVRSRISARLSDTLRILRDLVSEAGIDCCANTSDAANRSTDGTEPSEPIHNNLLRSTGSYPVMRPLAFLRAIGSWIVGRPSDMPAPPLGCGVAANHHRVSEGHQLRGDAA